MAKATKSSKTADAKANDALNDDARGTPEPDAIEQPEPVDDSVVSPPEEFDPSTEQDEPEAGSEISEPSPESNAPETGPRSGIMPMLLGGIIAATIGFLAAKSPMFETFLPESWRSVSATELTALSQSVESQTERVSNVSDQLANLSVPDLSGIETALAEHSDRIASVNARLDETNSKLETVDLRLADLEKRPISEGVSQGAIEAYERELKALQDSVAAQRSEIESLLADARAIEENAEMTAQDALARAALTRVLSAIDSGGAFDAALSDLEAVTGTQAPEALASVAQNGVAPMIQLQDSFPEAARAALSAARLSEPDSKHSLTSFLQRQLGARSVAPKEGTDPDAVLSRAEAALKDGRLNDALAEIETLPEAASAAMANWVSRASARREAQDAVETLAQSLNSN